VDLVLDGVADDRAVREWCSHVRSLLAAGGADVITCDVEGLDGAAGAVLDALARLQLTARRCGGDIRLRHPHGALEELVAIAGLAEVLPVCGRSVDDR
jgi:anti-anti-sigma regulatory factor